MTNKELTAALEVANNRIKELETELELSKQAGTAPAPVQPSKSKQQAEAALKLLQAGTVSVEMLKEINPKYPNDPIHFVRTILKVPVTTNRQKDGKTSYSLAVASTKQEDASKTDDKEGELLQAAAA